MKHILDGCGIWIKEEVLLKEIYCEKCLKILHKRAAQKFLLAYEYLCDVKRQRYEAAFKAVSKEVEERDNLNDSEVWKEAISVDME
jgi:reverse gyrase